MTRPLAVITGASGGLGVTLARAIGQGGHAVLLVDRDPRVVDVATSLAGDGMDARPCVGDLSTDVGVGEVVTAVEASGGEVRLLVNNAGITRDARLEKMSPEQFRQVVDVNLVAAMRLTLALEDHLTEGSSVVSLASRAALGNYGQANYVTAKSALVGFTRALALSWSPRVRANAIAPGLIDTPMTQAMPPDVLESLVAKVPVGRIGRPDDIAAAVLWLASDAASYVSGQCIMVCGGRSIAR